MGPEAITVTQAEKGRGRIWAQREGNQHSQLWDSRWAKTASEWKVLPFSMRLPSPEGRDLRPGGLNAAAETGASLSFPHAPPSRPTHLDTL